VCKALAAAQACVQGTGGGSGSYRRLQQQQQNHQLALAALQQVEVALDATIKPLTSGMRCNSQLHVVVSRAAILCCEVFGDHCVVTDYDTRHRSKSGSALFGCRKLFMIQGD
jgi:hypothetical protein